MQINVECRCGVPEGFAVMAEAVARRLEEILPLHAECDAQLQLSLVLYEGREVEGVQTIEWTVQSPTTSGRLAREEEFCVSLPLSDRMDEVVKALMNASDNERTLVDVVGTIMERAGSSR